MGASSTHEDGLLTVQPGDPSYLYNLSKLTGESLCHASGKSGVRVVRLSNVVGPNMDPATGNFIAALLNDAHNGHIFLRSDLESSKDYIHIDDVVKGLLFIALEGKLKAYNLASGENITHKNWIDWMRKFFNFDFSIEPNAPRQLFQLIEMDVLKKELNFNLNNVLNYSAISISR
jgi:nucleoside-diphosphate-sugar epimerase